TTWTIKEPSNPVEAKASSLASVSCTSSTACVAVGRYIAKTSGEGTLAEPWNGTAWTLKEPLNPTEAKGSSLTGVSCTSSTVCVAVGRYINKSSVEVTLAETWNGTAWTLKEPLNPAGAKSSALLGVSCTSSTACTAVGHYVNSSSVEMTLAESWSGTAGALPEKSEP